MNVPFGHLILQMSLNHASKHDRQIGSKDKNPQIWKGVKKKDDPSEDMKILKRIFDIINFSVLEELIRYLKFMKILRSQQVISWIKYDGTKMKSTLTMFLYIIKRSMW